MRRLVVAVALLAACRKSPVVEQKSITEGVHDTGAGWYPDVYAVPIPPTGVTAQKWAEDPARHATWAREPDCTVAEICDDDGFAYRAKTKTGGDLFVTYNGAGSVRRAELTEERVSAFELVFVPDLPFLLLEVESAPKSTDGGARSWRRLSPDSHVYDPYPAYRAAFERQQRHEDATRLVGSYVTAFGVHDPRFVLQAYRAPIFRDGVARAGLMHELCGPIQLPASSPSPSFRTRIDAERVASLRQVYLPLIREEQDGRVLEAAMACFVEPSPVPTVAKELASRLVRAACTARDDAAYEHSADAYVHAGWSNTAFEKDLKAFIRAETNACADGPYKQRMLAEYARRDHERDLPSVLDAR